MNPATFIAKHFREIYFGGNWTGSNLKEHLADVTWQEATMKVYDFNTIATLVFHIHYYVTITLPVLKGGVLDGHDKFSFAHPPIESKEDWEKFLENIRAEAEEFMTLVEQLPESKFLEIFAEEKYGNYYRNLHGIIEHGHYHLGQIVLIKRLIRQKNMV